MFIGLDFDNTIVNYDSVFYQVALQQKVVPSNIAPNKMAVRNFLRQAGERKIMD